MTFNAMGSIKPGMGAIADDLQDIIHGAAPVGAPTLQDEAPGSGSFARSMTSALQSVNDQDRAASEKMTAVDSGQSDDLIGAMMSSQQASLSFSMLMQVRNKVMGAIDDLVKLPL